MYAVFQAQGHQYKVSEGDEITLDRFEAPAGAVVTFEEVLMTGGDAPKVGTPFVEGATVTAEVVEQTRGPKLIIYKHRRRKSSKRLRGFKSHLTRVRITGIQA